MSENPRTSEAEIKPEWQEAIKQGILEALDNFELFGQINFSPASISGWVDERGFPGLSPVEQGSIEGFVFEQVGFDPQNAQEVATYLTKAPEGASWTGEVKVCVYATGRSEENMFLHKITFPDGKKDWLVAPKDFRL